MMFGCRAAASFASRVSGFICWLMDRVMDKVYSPKRVTGMGELMGLIPGMALDLTTDDVDGQPWDFNDPQKRTRAMVVRDKKALLIVGSPM